MNRSLHVKYPLFVSDFNETWTVSTDFRKIFQFQDNPSSGSQAVPCGWTNMTKLIVAFSKFAKAPKKNWTVHGEWTWTFLYLCPVHTRGTNIHRQTDDRKRCMEANMNYEFEFVVLAYFKALFQFSRIGIRFMAGIPTFDTAFRPALVKAALSSRLIWPERKATHSLSFRVVIIDLWSHSPYTSSLQCHYYRTAVTLSQSRRELNPRLSEYSGVLTTQLWRWVTSVVTCRIGSVTEDPAANVGPIHKSTV
jgi:hypothetical protein